jgi:Fungal protein of unknown function (DUF1752)
LRRLLLFKSHNDLLLSELEPAIFLDLFHDSVNALDPQPKVQGLSSGLRWLGIELTAGQGNKSFVPFSNLNDTEALTKTWKVSGIVLDIVTGHWRDGQVCTKVASFLEQGQRLENMSWRLWHLQNLMVDTDNAKSKREFRKLSKCMGDKLDKEKGRWDQQNYPI